MTAVNARPALILGSASPRRNELLAVLGLRYDVIRPATEEVPRPGEAPEAYALRNAAEKADWVAAAARATGRYGGGFVLISADTIVVLDGDILEKPRDDRHAAEMLRRLSGRTHTVISGVTLLSADVPAPRRSAFAVHTAVRLKRLSDHEIASYVRTGEPLDKAGAYAAQGIGSYMVESIEGSYANVVGLPVAQVVERLESEFALPLWEP